ncbi:hypothetical protein [Croceibacterium ferulae]|uniref:hypothetical protein n=1 Tax=Croceibacterium ferulae TaxID=1854641 RepID=UPI001F4E8432|nr:hypothetical protein [Croceibacterium ferulae]
MQDDLLATPDGQWLAERTRQAGPALLANSREVQLRGVMAEVGLEHLPCYLAQGQPGLVRLDAEPSIVREIWMGVHRDTRSAPRIVAVQEALVAGLENSRALLRGASPPG